MVNKNNLRRHGDDGPEVIEEVPKKNARLAKTDCADCKEMRQILGVAPGDSLVEAVRKLKGQQEKNDDLGESSRATRKPPSVQKKQSENDKKKPGIREENLIIKKQPEKKKEPATKKGGKSEANKEKEKDAILVIKGTPITAGDITSETMFRATSLMLDGETEEDYVLKVCKHCLEKSTTREEFDARKKGQNVSYSDAECAGLVVDASKAKKVYAISYLYAIIGKTKKFSTGHYTMPVEDFVEFEPYEGDDKYNKKK